MEYMVDLSCSIQGFSEIYDSKLKLKLFSALTEAAFMYVCVSSHTHTFVCQQESKLQEAALATAQYPQATLTSKEVNRITYMKQFIFLEQNGISKLPAVFCCPWRLLLSLVPIFRN